MKTPAMLKRIRPQAEAEPDPPVRIPDLHDWRSRNGSAYTAVHFAIPNTAWTVDAAATECRRVGAVLDGGIGEQLNAIATEWESLKGAADAFETKRKALRKMLVEVATELNMARAKQVVSEFALSPPGDDDLKWICAHNGERGIVFSGRVWHDILSNRNRLHDLRNLLEHRRSGGGAEVEKIVLREMGEQLW